MSSVAFGDAYPLGGPTPRGVSTRYSIPLDAKPISLGPFPFTARSISIVNQTGGTITVTDDRGEQYVASSLTEVTYGLGPTLRLTAQLSALQTSGKASVVVFDTPQPLSSAQLSTLTPTEPTLQIAHNGALVGTEPTLDFEDAAAIAFAIANDPANNRVTVTGPRIMGINVNGDGSVAGGTSGFNSVSRLGVGRYNVQWVAFAAGHVPVCVASVNNAATGNEDLTLSGIGISGVQVNINDAGAQADRPFSLIVIPVP